MQAIRQVAGIVTLLVASGASAQQADISFKTTEVAPGLFMLEGQGGFTGGNLGLSVGEDGVILIDDGVTPLADRTIAAVKKTTGRPVDFVVNTHVHGDHVGGNAALHEQGARIIAHDRTRQRMVEQGLVGAQENTPAPEGALPEMTFSDSLTMHLNGEEAFVFHVGAAHTDGDAVIYFRDSDVIHTGDILFNGIFPYIDLGTGGSVEGYIAAQDDVLSLAGENTKIIPGHGPLATKADLEAARNMLRDARDRVRRLIDEGKSEDDVVSANPLADYEGWSWEFITTERITRTLYRDLSGG